MAIKSFRDLQVWQRSYGLVLELYRMTRHYPDNERYGLTSQIRRSAASIPANIAEGHGRDATGDYVRFLWIAHGSLSELETHILLARDLGYTESAGIQAILMEINEIGLMLRSLIRSVRKHQKESE